MLSSSSWNLTFVTPFNVTLLISVSSSSVKLKAADLGSLMGFCDNPIIPSSSGGTQPDAWAAGTASFNSASFFGASTGALSFLSSSYPTVPPVAASTESTASLLSFALLISLAFCLDNSTYFSPNSSFSLSSYGLVSLSSTF